MGCSSFGVNWEGNAPGGVSFFPRRIGKSRTRFLLAAEPDKGTKKGGQLNDVRGSLGGVMGGRARTWFTYPDRS
jgi:hypothetical protein